MNSDQFSWSQRNYSVGVFFNLARFTVTKQIRLKLDHVRLSEPT